VGVFCREDLKGRHCFPFFIEKK